MSLKRIGNVTAQKVQAGTRQPTAWAWYPSSRSNRAIPQCDPDQAKTKMQNANTSKDRQFSLIRKERRKYRRMPSSIKVLRQLFFHERNNPTNDNLLRQIIKPQVAPYFTTSTFTLTFNLSPTSSSASLQVLKFNFGGTSTMPFIVKSGVPLMGAGAALVSMLSMLMPCEAR
ncbi:MAG: hypothetical protein RIR73_2138 [Chloroflexota bacterium]